MMSEIHMQIRCSDLWTAYIWSHHIKWDFNITFIILPNLSIHGIKLLYLSPFVWFFRRREETIRLYVKASRKVGDLGMQQRILCSLRGMLAVFASYSPFDSRSRSNNNRYALIITLLIRWCIISLAA